MRRLEGIFVIIVFFGGFAIGFGLGDLESAETSVDAYKAIIDVCGRHFASVNDINACIDGIWGDGS